MHNPPNPQALSEVRSKFRFFTAPATAPWRIDWTKAEVDSALAEFDNGQFFSAGQLIDQMLRDDTLAAVLEKRTLGLIRCDRVIQPAKGTDPRKARRAAAETDAAFESWFPRATLAKLLATAHMAGIAVAQIIWVPSSDGSRWDPWLQPWHPSHVYWRWDLRRYCVQTQEEGFVVIEPGDGRWLLFAPHGYERGWLEGAVRSLAIPWLARQYAWRDWQRWSELYSLGVRKGMVPADASEESKDKFFTQVAALGSETTVLLEKALGGDGYDIDVLWPDTAGSADGFERLLSKCEARYAIRLLGNNLTTEVQQGSLAASKTHAVAENNLIAADAVSLGECVHEQVLRPEAAFNRGNPDLASTVGWDTAPPEDRKAQADALVSLSTALEKFLMLGIQVDTEQLAEQYAIPLLAGGDGAPLPRAPEAPPPAAMATLARGRPVPRRSMVKGQLYADRLADEAIARARKLLGGDADAVLEAIEAGDSYDDIRRRLLKVYTSMDPSKLAELVERMGTQAELSGRATVLEESER